MYLQSPSPALCMLGKLSLVWNIARVLMLGGCIFSRKRLGQLKDRNEKFRATVDPYCLWLSSSALRLQNVNAESWEPRKVWRSNNGHQNRVQDLVTYQKNAVRLRTLRESHN